MLLLLQLMLLLCVVDQYGETACGELTTERVLGTDFVDIFGGVVLDAYAVRCIKQRSAAVCRSR